MAVARFEMWALLKFIALCEFALAGFMFYLLVSEFSEMGRLHVAITYGGMGIVLLWTGYNSVIGAHKCYTGFWKPKAD